jgi:hypothetical protein
MPGCFVESSVKDLFFCVALTAGELVVGDILVISIGVMGKWNPTGKLCECNVDGKFSKKRNFFYDMLFTSEFCLCFFFDLGVLLSLSCIS